MSDHTPTVQDDRAIAGPVLVTGAGSELAQALLRRLMDEGTPVLGACQSAGGLAAATRSGVPCAALDAPEDLPGLCERHFGRPPACYVDTAHSRLEGLVAQVAPDAVDRWAREDIALRARRLAAVTRAMLAARHGRCLFISSAAADRAAPGQGYYAAAKLAGEALFTSAGLELGARGVTACCLRLGWLDCGRGREFLARRPGEAEQLIPTRRLVTVAEAVEAMRFLLTKAALSFNATTLTLDGGFGATKPFLK